MSSQQQQQVHGQLQIVDSLLDAMEDGNEYGSIVSLVPKNPDLMSEFRRAIADIEQIRKRPCVCYIANVIKDVPDTGITAADHLPFSEMIARVDKGHRDVDIFLVTPGGSAEQVTFFVETLRTRFDSVDFLIPYKAMSAGTLWALSGDRIWMDSRGFLGPIDPQIPSKDGRFVPMQSVLTLLNHIQKIGDDAIKKGLQPPWSHIVLLKELDPRIVGHAITASNYVINMAAQYLNLYKFKTWTTHRTHNAGSPVTPEEREARALEAAQNLCSHDRWKAHGHAINRDVLYREIKIEINAPDAALERCLRRLWALCYFVFDKGAVTKIMMSGNYTVVRQTMGVQLLGGHRA